MSSSDSKTLPDKAALGQDELDDLREEMRGIVRERIKRWAIRWTIGLLLVAGAVLYRPDMLWMLPVAAAFAILALFGLLGGAYLTMRRLKRAAVRLREHEAALAALSAEAAAQEQGNRTTVDRT